MFDALETALKTQFPKLKIITDDEKKEIIIPANHRDVGNIRIQEHGEEFIIFIGDFTHWHAAGDDGESGNRLKDILEEVTEFLTDMFQDKIFVWGSNARGGGTIYIDDFETDKNGYVWSGPYSS